MTSRLLRLIPRERPLLKWTLFFGLTAVALTIDLVTKYVAEDRLALGDVHEVLPFLSLQLTKNDGVAFGLLGGSTTVIVIANVFAMLVIALYVVVERRPVFGGIVGGVVLGGSLGNFVQRLWGDGHVTDFLKFPNWPNFNAADVFIDAGLAALVIGVIVELARGWREKKQNADSSE